MNRFGAVIITLFGLLFALGSAGAEANQSVEISASNKSQYGEYFDRGRQIWRACARTAAGEFIRGKTVDQLGLPVRLAIGVYFVYGDKPPMQRVLERYEEVRDELSQRIAVLTRKSKYRFVRKIFNSRQIKRLTEQLLNHERAIARLSEEMRLCAEAIGIDPGGAGSL